MAQGRRRVTEHLTQQPWLGNDRRRQASAEADAVAKSLAPQGAIFAAVPVPDRTTAVGPAELSFIFGARISGVAYVVARWRREHPRADRSRRAGVHPALADRASE